MVWALRGAGWSGACRKSVTAAFVGFADRAASRLAHPASIGSRRNSMIDIKNVTMESVSATLGHQGTVCDAAVKYIDSNFGLLAGVSPVERLILCFIAGASTAAGPLEALHKIATLRPAGDVEKTKGAAKLVAQMERIALDAANARADMNWNEADRLRAILDQHGISYADDSGHDEALKAAIYQRDTATDEELTEIGITREEAAERVRSLEAGK
jgi:hypothetical protein